MTNANHLLVEVFSHRKLGVPLVMQFSGVKLSVSFKVHVYDKDCILKSGLYGLRFLQDDKVVSQ